MSDSARIAAMRYVIHPTLEIRLCSARKGYRRYFEHEFARVAGYEGAADRTVITVSIVPRLPPPRPGDRYRRKRAYGLFEYEFLIRGMCERNVEIYFREHPFGILYPKIVTLFLQGQLLEPIVYHALLQRRVLLMHAAGVSNGSDAYLFPAHGGTGKTTLALRLMADGYLMLGDDLVLVDAESGLVRPYARPLHLFSYNLGTFPGARIPFDVVLKVRTKDVIRWILKRALRRSLLISTRVDAERLYGPLPSAPASRCRKICFLTAGGTAIDARRPEASLEQAVEEVANTADLNDSLCEHILDSDEVPAFRALERSVIREVVGWVDSVTSANAREPDGYERILKLVGVVDDKRHCRL